MSLRRKCVISFRDSRKYHTEGFMQRVKKIITRVLIVFAVCICSGCSACETNHRIDSISEFVDNINYIIKGVTGKCLTREEMAHMLQIFDNICENWNGYSAIERGTNREITVPALKLETPGEHYHDENTRYEISLLEKNYNGIHKGIKVTVMQEGACKIDVTPKPTASAEPRKTEAPASSQEPARTPAVEITPEAESTPEAVVPEEEKEPEYVWHLVSTEVVKGENENGAVHKNVYTAEELKHACTRSGVVEIPEHKTVVSSFTATCDRMPTDVAPGEEVIIHLSMTMDNNNDTYHYGADAAMAFGRPSSGATWWGPAAEGGPDRCHMDAIGDWGHEPVRVSSATVKGTFPVSTSEGHQVVVTFAACGSDTYWTYELMRKSALPSSDLG